jgi:hypothetical protein
MRSGQKGKTCSCAWIHEAHLSNREGSLLRFDSGNTPSRGTGLAVDSTSIIYNDHPASHNMSPFGETNMPQVNQPADESKKSWAINPRSRIRKKPHRNRPWPAAPTRRRSRLSPPNRSPARKGNRAVKAVSPEAKNRRGSFLAVLLAELRGVLGVTAKAPHGRIDAW